ncbi:MAG: tRNA (adenosine(37)-N6)-threonylcarbamoyltransferase complex transferase subunit TsaD [Synergistota bacterium]|nr:tRNA (adenosine(37)-N6)-threonylcarbamoyltransferase complex transferase subunit TsaD [Synergistota bacterium]
MAVPFLTLGIETSCDDTGVALLRGDRDIAAEALSSQVKDHAPFGGVVPELASRKHQEVILPMLSHVLGEAGVDSPGSQVDLVAVTRGPGLMGSLLVGVMTAKALAQAWGVPLVGVNHIEGHLFANIISHPELEPPFLCLVASGGHTEIAECKAPGSYRLLGMTRDDAVGECYDKTAKLLGLPYPGGPVIDGLAAQGDPGAFPFPSPLSSTDRVEFSFSGLKTAVLWAVKRLKRERGERLPAADICASFQKAAVRSLVDKTLLAVSLSGIHKVCVSGGVAANSLLRSEMRRALGKNAFFPPGNLCTDNAVMIAAAGKNRYDRCGADGLDISADPADSLYRGPE